MQANETIGGVKFEKRLTEDDKECLKAYDAKIEELKVMTNMVIIGSETGLLLTGSGGNGKSWSIREALKARGVNEITPEQTAMMDEDSEDEESAFKVAPGFNTFIVHQGRVTPKGLVKRMAQFPNSVHLVEDAETMFDDKTCWGVLRMALHSQDHSLHSERRITWTTSNDKGTFDFHFRGGLIIVGNRDLPNDSPEVQAVRTRCNVVKLDVSNEELIAKMKQMCEQGYKGIVDAPSKGKMRRGDRVAMERKAALEVDEMNRLKKFKGEAEKLLEWCKRAFKDTAWYDLPKSSPERVKRLNALRKDYFQKTH